MSIAQTLHRLERIVLPLVKTNTTLQELVSASKLKEIEVMRALQWLENKKLISTKEEKQELINLDSNGDHYKLNGLPEKVALQALAQGKLSTQELQKKGIDAQEINIIIGTLKRLQAATIEKIDKQLVLQITKAGKELAEKESKEEKFLQKQFPIQIETLTKEEKETVKALRSRKKMLLLETKKTIFSTITKQGQEILKEGINENAGVDKLTPQMLEDGSWQKKEFRAYDVSINVPNIAGGKRHFVNEAVEYIKRIWLSMGFSEMQGTMVQTSFWDLDALFVPQDHPARQMQDTFYIKDPKEGKLPKDWKKIKEVHENGGNTGSTGWQGKYSESIAKKNLLRTHNTVLSAQTIAKLKESDMPAKFFSVGKVFRNEALDYKHLFEFYQVEGIVVDPKANFRNLIGYLKEFFMKMGYLDIRIRPAFFPYTYTSAEVEVLHPTRKTWMELGGSGIFRPEVTAPLIGKEVPVLAWGLGMGRIIAEYWKMQDIRDLYRNDIKQLQKMKSFLK